MQVAQLSKFRLSFMYLTDIRLPAHLFRRNRGQVRRFWDLKRILIRENVQRSHFESGTE